MTQKSGKCSFYAQGSPAELGAFGYWSFSEILDIDFFCLILYSWWRNVKVLMEKKNTLFHSNCSFWRHQCRKRELDSCGLFIFERSRCAILVLLGNCSGVSTLSMNTSILTIKDSGRFTRRSTTEKTKNKQTNKTTDLSMSFCVSTTKLFGYLTC